MTRSNLTRAAAGLLGFLILVACAGQGFNERLAAGYSTVSFARDSAGLLLDAGVIDSHEAANVQVQADNLRAALDLTRTIAATDPATAEAKLQATLLALDGLRAYLAKLQRDKGLP